MQVRPTQWKVEIENWILISSRPDSDTWDFVFAASAESCCGNTDGILVGEGALKCVR